MSVKSIVYSRLFLTLLMAGILVPWALSCGDGSLPIGGGTQGPSGLLGLVPGGYERVTRWEVSKLLSGEGLEDLQDEFQDSWEWLEEYGIFSDDLTELVVAEDGRGNTLLLFAGELDFEGIRDDLDDAGFRDSTYRNVEVWEQRRGDLVVALLEGGKEAVLSSPGDDGVKDVIQAMDRESGFLLQDKD